MDDEWFPILGDEYDDLEGISGPIRPDDQPPIRFLPCVLDGECVVDGMDDLLVGNAVPTGGRQYLHPIIVLRKAPRATGRYRAVSRRENLDLGARLPALCASGSSQPLRLISPPERDEQV